MTRATHRALRIALVSRYFHPFVGGIEVVEQQLAELLAREGHSVTVHTALLPRTAKTEVRDGYSIRRYTVGVTGFFWPDLGSADIVHMHGADRAFTAALAAFSRQPVIVTMHAGLFGNTTDRGFVGYTLKRCYDSILTRYVYNRFAAVISLDEREGSHMRSLGVRANLSHQVLNPVPHESYFNVQKPDGERNGFLFLGRISEEKRIDRIIAATASVGYSLTIAGEGPSALVAALKLQAHEAKADVRFVGQLQGREKVNAFASAKALVMASPREGQSISVLEAMMLETPVLIPYGASAMPGLDDSSAVLYDRADPKALAAAMQKIVLNQEEILQKTRRARALVAEQHSPEKFCRQHESIYHEALEKTRAMA